MTEYAVPLRRTYVAVLALTLLVCNITLAAPHDHHNARITWQQSSLRLIQAGGVYGRMARLPDRKILCAVELNGSVYVKSSTDEGRTWTIPLIAATFPYGNAANPELTVLADNTVLLAYNERPRDGVHPFAIRLAESHDNGLSWHAHRTLYSCGLKSDTGCWEPAMVQLPSGEIQLFFANEKPFPNTTEQEITLLRSFDNASTWTTGDRISLRANHRDGMPVPLLLKDTQSVVVAIEDDGLSGSFKPAILSTAASSVITGNSPQRWAALETPLPAPVYAGAPYLRQFPSGETVLSVQSGQGTSNSSALDNSHMLVFIGDQQARAFTKPTEPFAGLAQRNGLWNSLFIKNAVTVTALSTTTINGIAGLWAIDGTLSHTDAAIPAVHAVVNALSGVFGPVNSGEYVSLYGVALSPSINFPVDVRLDGIPANVLYSSPNQINAVIPEVIGRNADVTVRYGVIQTDPYPLGFAVTAKAAE